MGQVSSERVASGKRTKLIMGILLTILISATLVMTIIRPFPLASGSKYHDGQTQRQNQESSSFDGNEVDEDILRVFGRPEKDPSFDGCETAAYPPTHILPPPDEYIINLDLPPEYRWIQVANDKGKYISAMLDGLKNYTSSFLGGRLFDYVNEYLPVVGAALPSPYREEIQGMSLTSGIPFGEMILYNIFYELFTVCTSIIAQDPSGQLYHARNLDFGLFLGWDIKNQTWLTTENLRPMVVKLTFQKSNKTVFQSVSFAGYIGILTGLKKDTFTLTINERFTLKGGFIGVLEWLMGKPNLNWLGFLTRDVMEQATSYKDAQKMLMKSPLLAPAYFILGGVRPGQACVITRGQKKVDVWTLGESPDKLKNYHDYAKWYLVQTNYDHWRKPPFWDDRRTPAITCMDKAGQSGLGFKSLYNVLSTRPVLNKLTTYTALMRVNGTLEIYLRDCEQPCWPW